MSTMTSACTMQTMANYRLICTVLSMVLSAAAFSLRAQPGLSRQSLTFEKKMIAAEAFESVAVLDIDQDGIMDILSGSFWYKGPAFIQRKFIGPINRHNEYYDDFSGITMDVNKDGKQDLITGGWFGGILLWKENPGPEGVWKEHVIASCGNIETTRAWDIDKDGIVEIIPNTPGKPLVLYRLKRQSENSISFDSIKIYDKQGHGLGYGDVNGDGLGDLIIDKGWLECPSAPFSMPWTFHPEFAFVQASVPMLVTDVNSDGKADLIVGQGHDYGLYWYEQKLDKGRNRSWFKHAIDPDNSQFHTMEWVDIDNDGKNELVTGKRYRAHDDNDPGAHDPVGLYYFRWNGENFSKQVISYGSPGVGKGTGLYFQVVDIDNNGWKDIIVAGKDGLCIFYNKGATK